MSAITYIHNLSQIGKFTWKNSAISRFYASTFKRLYSGADCGVSTRKGLVLGAYTGEGGHVLTPTAKSVNDNLEGKIEELLKGIKLKRGKVHVLYNISKEYSAIAIAGLGKEKAGINQLENLNECKENIRVAAGVGAMRLQDDGISSIHVEEFTNAEAAAEGATLGVWQYQELRSKANQKPLATVDLFASDDKDGWKRGVIKGEAQNIARRLEEMPPNLLTPSIFARECSDIVCPCKVHVDIRDRDFLESKKMSAFLAVARGSCEPPVMLELGYCGGKKEDTPIMIIGKGMTFNSGGLCLKQCKGMPMYRADMAGAAVIVGVMKAIAQMNLPINVNALIPLCENLPSGMALMPGDVLLGMNGKTIRIESPEQNGRVILTDCLFYSQMYKPHLVITIGTFSTDMWQALATSATGVFSTSEKVWELMNYAGTESGDRVWRFPFWKHFTWKVTDYLSVDTSNVGKGIGGDALRAAAFLLEFAPPVKYCHMDISGTGMLATGLGYPYLRKGLMSGRPVRTLVEFLYQSACRHDKGADC